MTKNAVLTTYQTFLDQLSNEMLTIVEDEFGGGLLGKVAKTGAKTATRRIEAEMQRQGDLIVEYAAAIANGDENQSQYERQFLRTNPVYKRYNGEETEELEQHLLAHFRTVGADLAPLVASEKDNFWLALRDEYERTEAENLVERHFRQADTFMKYKSGIFSSAILANRVITIIEKGESRLREDIYTELDRVYDES